MSSEVETSQYFDHEQEIELVRLPTLSPLPSRRNRPCRSSRSLHSSTCSEWQSSASRASCVRGFNHLSRRKGALGHDDMASDETLLKSVTVPSIRFYRSHSPGLSFLYFGKLQM